MKDKLERKLRLERVNVCVNCRRFEKCNNIAKFEECVDFKEVEGEAWTMLKLACPNSSIDK